MEMTCRFVLAFLVYAGANAILVMLAAMLCVYVGPSAAGSGIPEVKAYLNGVDTPNVFSLNTLFVKVGMSTSLSLSPCACMRVSLCVSVYHPITFSPSIPHSQRAIAPSCVKNLQDFLSQRTLA